MDFIEKFYDHAAIYMEYKKIGISKWNSDTVQKNYSYMNLVIQIEITACQSDIHDLPLIPVMGMLTKSTKCVCPWPLTSIIYMTTD